MGKKNNTSYITTPIYYASGNVHIGNSYTTIVCDAFARFRRLQGVDTFYLTGMDEHGLKIQEAATKQGKTPQALTDEIAASTKALWKDLDITNDYFIRTTDDYHVINVQNAFEKMLANGDIYLGSYEGDYCVACESFFTKTQITTPGMCPDCGKPLRKVKEECYFFKLSKYQNKLLEFINNNPGFIEPESRKNEVVSFIQSGLEDFSVSRTTFTWGIPVISNPKHVVYVWLDALLNYVSALGYGHDETNYKKYWLDGKEVVHVVGKDILRFHAVYWPCFLMSLGIPVNFKLYVHGWVLMKDGKMSKSVGNVVYPHDVIDRYGLDSLRYYLLKEMPLGNDCIFSYDRFLERYNSDLVNDLGNLLKRSVSMINKYFGGSVSKPKELRSEFSKEVEDVINNSIKNVINNFDNFRFQNGLIELWNIVTRANKYIDETQPWVLDKDPNQKELLEEVMYVLVEALRNTLILLKPIIPQTALKIQEDLGLSDELCTYNSLGFGKLDLIKVKESVESLFNRLDITKELEELKKIDEAKHPKLKLKDEITIEDFEKLDLRVGKVVDAKKMEKSDKLLVLQVKIENEVRQIVSGISNSYTPNDMIGKYVVVVANLKPVKLRGEMSNGMILCASGTKEGALEVLEVHSENEFAKVK